MKSKNNRINYIVVAILLAGLILVSRSLSKYSLGVMNTALIYGIAAWSVSIMLGMCGQLTFSTVTFIGIGSYVVANVTTGRLGIKLPSIPALLLAALVAGLIAWLLGKVLFKLKGTYFTFATIAVVQVGFTFFNNYKPLFGGPDGISGIPTFSAGALKLSSYSKWFYFLLIITVVLGILVARVRSTQLGRSLAAIRDNETAALTFGIDIYRSKVTAFTLAGILGGLAGGLYAMHIRFISADMFNYSSAAQIIIMAMLGGVNSTGGVIIGAILVNVLPEFLRSLQNYMQLIWGVLIIILMIFMPSGLGGMYELVKNRIRRRTVVKKSPSEEEKP